MKFMSISKKQKVPDVDTAMKHFFHASHSMKKTARKGVLLLVEDDPESISIIAGMVDGKAKVISVESLRMAREKVKDVGIDNIVCAVIDYYLPDGTGLDVADMLEKECPGLPMFLISSDEKIVKKVNGDRPYLTPVLKWDLDALGVALSL